MDCWEVQHRLKDYLKSDAGLAFVKDAIGDAVSTIDWDNRSGTTILDALHNCHSHVIGVDLSEANYERVEYAKGIFVGVMAGLVYAGLNFDGAWEQILRRVEIREDCIPEGWPVLAHYEGTRQ